MGARSLRLCCAILLMVMVVTVGTGIVSAQWKATPGDKATQVCPHHASELVQSGAVALFPALGDDFSSVTYTIRSGSFEVAKTLYFTSGERELSFEQLPFGSYTLYKNGTFCCRFTLSAEQPRLILSIT